MPFLLLRRLPDALLIFVDAVDDLGIVVGNVEHFARPVTRHAKVLNQQYQLQSILVRYRIVLPLVQQAEAVLAHCSLATQLLFRIFLAHCLVGRCSSYQLLLIAFKFHSFLTCVISGGSLVGQRVS